MEGFMKRLLILLSCLSIGKNFGMHTNSIAPKLFQRLQEYGIKKLGAKPLPPVKITNYPCYACTQQIGRSGKRYNQIYINHSHNQTFVPYGVKKVVKLHEIVHTQQPLEFINGSWEYPVINPEYPHHETEADTEALKHTQCYFCAQKFSYKLPLKSLFCKNYLNLFQALKITYTKKASSITCPYHQEMQKKALYRVIYYLPALAGLGAYLALRGCDPMPRVLGALTSIYTGFKIKNLITLLIGKSIEKRIEDGELEP